MTHCVCLNLTLNNWQVNKTWDLQVSNFADHFSTFDLKIPQTFRLHLSPATLPSQFLLLINLYLIQNKRKEDR